MRPIDADALIALVQDSTILGDGFKQAFCALVNGEPTIEPERKTGKWIPCSDKIPSEAQECWITAKDGTVCQGMFTRQYGERRDSGFICNNGFAWLNTVVAWMPYDMPEPYQKEGE